MQRGKTAGHSSGMPQSAEQYLPELPSTQSALSQSASPEHATPTPPSPRAPGLQKTLRPEESSLTHEKPGPQSSEEKHGQSVFTAHAPPSQ